MSEYDDELKNAYRAKLERSQWARDVAAAAWYKSWEFKRGGQAVSVSANGHTIKSYNHVVGVTICLVSGVAVKGHCKVAFDCHASATTSKHCGPIKAVADLVVTPCPSCVIYRGTEVVHDANRPKGQGPAISAQELLNAQNQ